MKVKSLTPVIATYKLKESKEFYTLHLGFKPIFEIDWYVQLRSDGDTAIDVAFVLPNHETQPRLFRPAFCGSGAIYTIEVSANLAVIASGLSLTMTATWNMVVSSSTKEFTGISVGVGALLLFIGMAIGPALAGVYMENNGAAEGSYPSPESYNLVFLTAGLLSALSVGFALVLRRKAANQKIEV